MLSLLPSDITEQCTLKALNIFTLTSCSCARTHTDTVKSLERAEVKLSVFDYHRLFPLPFFPYAHFSFSPRVVSVVVQVSQSVSAVQCSRVPNKDGLGQ